MPDKLSADEINTKIGEYYNELSEMLEQIMNKQKDINIQDLLNRIENDLNIIVTQLKDTTPEFKQLVSQNLEGFSILVSKCHEVVRGRMEDAKLEVQHTQQHRHGIQAYNAVRQK